MKNLSPSLLALFASALLSVYGASAFVPISSISKTFVNTNSLAPPQTSVQKQRAEHFVQSQPIALQRQRRSMAQVATMGLFGLGAPEIAIILIAGAFLLGPQKLAELGKDAGKMAGELKEVPKEFQKGLEEGEVEAQKLKKEITGQKAPVKDVEAE